MLLVSRASGLVERTTRHGIPPSLAMDSAPKAVLAPLGIAVCVFALYVGFPSQMYEVNGIIEADAIEHWSQAQMFNANHMLYRPIMWLLYHGLIAFGYSGSILSFLQFMSAVFGTVGIVLIYLILRDLTQNVSLSCALAAGYAVTRQYWYWSTDINYDIVSSMFVFWTAYLMIDRKERQDGRGHVVATAITSGAAVLVSQMNVFLVPVVVLAFLVNRAHPMRARLRRILHYGIGLTFIVVVPYLLVGLFVKRVTTLDQLRVWLTGWDAGGGVHVPTYGWFGWSRVVRGFQSYLESQAPPWNGVSIRKLILHGTFEPAQMLAGIATLLALAFLVGVFVGLLVAWPHLSNRQRTTAGLLLVYFVLFTSFGIWWDAPNPRWYFTASAGTWALAAMLLGNLHQSLPGAWQRRLLAITALAVLWIGGANFVTLIAPNHYSANTALERAIYVGTRMQPGDVFVQVRYDWSAYLTYFTGREVLSVQKVNGVPDRLAVLSHLQETLEDRRINGHRAYASGLEDDNSYEDYWQDVEFSTGLKESDVRALLGPVAWTFQGLTIREVVTPSAAGLLR